MALSQVKSSFERMDDPSEPLAHGAMILVAGVLLLTPGFFTDAVGFALLMPPIRVAVFKYLKSRINVQTIQTGTQYTEYNADVVDGSFEEVHENTKPSSKPSGWVKSDQQH